MFSLILDIYLVLELLEHFVLSELMDEGVIVLRDTLSRPSRGLFSTTKSPSREARSLCVGLCPEDSDVFSLSECF